MLLDLLERFADARGSAHGLIWHPAPETYRCDQEPQRRGAGWGNIQNPPGAIVSLGNVIGHSDWPGCWRGGTASALADRLRRPGMRHVHPAMIVARSVRDDHPRTLPQTGCERSLGFARHSVRLLSRRSVNLAQAH